MKNLTTLTRVHLFLNSHDFLLFNRKPKLDMRYNSSKHFMRLFYKLSKDFNKAERFEKLKVRRNADFVFENVLQNKIYNDYKKNFSDVEYVGENFIKFYGRNHHYKNSFDLKVIAILRKNFIALKIAV